MQQVKLYIIIIILASLITLSGENKFYYISINGCLEKAWSNKGNTSGTAFLWCHDNVQNCDNHFISVIIVQKVMSCFEF